MYPYVCIYIYIHTHTIRIHLHIDMYIQPHMHARAHIAVHTRQRLYCMDEECVVNASRVGNANANIYDNGHVIVNVNVNVNVDGYAITIVTNTLNVHVNVTLVNIMDDVYGFAAQRTSVQCPVSSGPCITLRADCIKHIRDAGALRRRGEHPTDGERRATAQAEDEADRDARV